MHQTAVKSYLQKKKIIKKKTVIVINLLVVPDGWDLPQTPPIKSNKQIKTKHFFFCNHNLKQIWHLEKMMIVEEGGGGQL